VPESIIETEALRQRWRSARAAFHLDDPQSDVFGSGGVARYFPDAAIRLVVLPPDPQRSNLTFDDDFWSWWTGPFRDPATEGEAAWGEKSWPCAEGAVRTDQYTAAGSWKRYIALLRNGGLDLGLGREGAYPMNLPHRPGEETRVFCLTTAVGRIWCALAIYRDFIDRTASRRPWEITVSLIRAKGALLGNFASGWSEPHELFADEFTRQELPGLQYRLEWQEWPERGRSKYFAFALGQWIEECWRGKSRRFIARIGDSEGNFDKMRCAWH
jgi:hypothetical protein